LASKNASRASFKEADAGSFTGQGFISGWYSFNE